MIELKPCPFCGGAAVLHVNDGARVMCQRCKIQTQTHHDLVDRYGVIPCAIVGAVDEWNKRVCGKEACWAEDVRELVYTLKRDLDQAICERNEAIAERDKAIKVRYKRRWWMGWKHGRAKTT